MLKARQVSIFRQRLLCGERILTGETWEDLGRPEERRPLRKPFPHCQNMTNFMEFLTKRSKTCQLQLIYGDTGCTPLHV